MQYKNGRAGDTLHLPDSEIFQPSSPPIVDGVPRLLYTEEQVATMFGMSAGTVRNRYNPNSKWYDPNFPEPRTTDGSGKGRKAAKRWHWYDLDRYSQQLPPMSSSRQLTVADALKGLGASIPREKRAFTF